MGYRLFGAIALSIATTFCSSLYAGSNDLIQLVHSDDKEHAWSDNSGDKKTLYIAHWTHTPENCPGRSGDGAKMLNKFWEGRKKAEEKGIRILGAYVTVTEHDYFILVEANDYAAVVEFFLPLVPSQTGKIVPVLTMDDWLKIMPK